MSRKAGYSHQARHRLATFFELVRLVRIMDDEKEFETYISDLYTSKKSKNVKNRQYDTVFFTLYGKYDDLIFLSNKDGLEHLGLDFIFKTVRVYIYACLDYEKTFSYSDINNELTEIVFDNFLPVIYYHIKSEKFKIDKPSFFAKNWRKAVVNIFKNFKKQKTNFKYLDFSDNKLSADLIFISLIIGSFGLAMLNYKKYAFGIYLMNQANFVLGIASTGLQVELDEFLKEFYYADIAKKVKSTQGQKGGITKGKNYAPVRQKVLEIHDRYYSMTQGNGKYLYSHQKTAREIIKELTKQNYAGIEAYTERSLANIIANYRKESTKGK
jgi:hypothetical protein